MSTEDDREKSREESPKWHRARAARLRANGFEKMAEEHEQIAEISNAGGSRNLVRGAKKSPARAGLSLGDHIVERAAHATRRLEMTSTDGCARDVMVITKMRFLLIGRK